MRKICQNARFLYSRRKKNVYTLPHTILDSPLFAWVSRSYRAKNCNSCKNQGSIFFSYLNVWRFSNLQLKRENSSCSPRQLHRLGRSWQQSALVNRFSMNTLGWITWIVRIFVCTIILCISNFRSYGCRNGQVVAPPMRCDCRSNPDSRVQVQYTLIRSNTASFPLQWIVFTDLAENAVQPLYFFTLASFVLLVMPSSTYK